MAVLDISYNSLKSVIGSYERYENLSKTPEGRIFLKHLASYSIPSLISKTKSYFSNTKFDVNNSIRQDFLELTGDLLRPGQGFSVEIRKKNIIGDTTLPIGDLVKSISLPNMKTNVLRFNRSGKDYTIPLNKKTENVVEMMLYSDNNRNFSNSINDLFINTDDYQFSNGFGKDNSIEIIYKREVDTFSSSKHNTVIFDNITNKLWEISKSIGKDYLKENFSDIFNIISALTSEMKPLKAGKLESLKKVFGDGSKQVQEAKTKRIIFEIHFKDVILNTIALADNDDEKIDNYSSEEMSFNFNRIESFFSYSNLTNGDTAHKPNYKNISI